MTANLRVTRQIVEVLAVGTPDLRITRQIVEVLTAVSGGRVLSALATDALSFSDSATTLAHVVNHAADTLTLTQMATAIRNRLLQPVADTLLFNQVATVVHENFNPAVVDTISFGDGAVCVHRNLSPKAIDSVTLTDFSGVTKASYFPQVQDSLTFADAANGTTLPSVITAVSARDSLSFVQQVTVVGPVVVSSQDVFGSTVTEVLGVTGTGSGQVQDVSLGLVDLASVAIVRSRLPRRLISFRSASVRLDSCCILVRSRVLRPIR